jgi:hypothetical protein
MNAEFRMQNVIKFRIKNLECRRLLNSEFKIQNGELKDRFQGFEGKDNYVSIVVSYSMTTIKEERHRGLCSGYLSLINS